MVLYCIAALTFSGVKSKVLRGESSECCIEHHDREHVGCIFTVFDKEVMFSIDEALGKEQTAEQCEQCEKYESGWRQKVNYTDWIRTNNGRNVENKPMVGQVTIHFQLLLYLH